MSVEKDIVLRVVRPGRIRNEHIVIFNGVEMRGLVVKTRVKGEIVWTTYFNGESVNGYDPQWLLRKNGRNVKLDGHGSSNFAATTRRAA